MTDVTVTIKFRFTFLLTLALLLLTAAGAMAQQLTISGRVTDALTGEALPGATVQLKELPASGAVADLKGNFSFTAPPATYTLLGKFVGYETTQLQLRLTRDRQVEVRLTPVALGVQEVEVVARRKQTFTETAAMGELELPLESIKSLPVLFGEVDVLKTLQLLPGVQSGGEGNTGFYVRGGGADQNLILLDEAVVYNPGHLLNFFSVFNSDALASTTLQKGNMPARYGGRLSSIIDIGLKEGSMTTYGAEGGLGLIASRLTVQGPLAKEKASFIFSGRRTYADALLNPFLKNTEQGGVPYYFYDLSGKLSWQVTPKDKLTLSGFSGKDVGSFNLSSGRFDADFSWGNALATARWQHLFQDNHEMQVTANLSDYTFNFSWDFGGYLTSVDTGIRDYSLKTDFDYRPNAFHHIRYGLHYTYHTLTPRTGEATSAEGDVFTTDKVRTKFAHAPALYISDDWNITDKLLLSAGLRVSYFAQVGPFSLYQFNQNLQPVDSVVYRQGEKVKDYHALEPRLSVRYELNSQSSVKAAFARSAQYVHLVSNAYTTLPLDVWVPSSALVEPQRATQYALGYFRSLRKNEYEASAEIYYKDLQQQLEYRENFAPGPSNRDLEYEFVTGSGKSYGVELFLRKNYGKLQGWLGYTHSYTTRTFPDINEGRTFPARFDTRHDASAVATYKLSDRWTFGGSFVYATGQATTLPVRRYFIEGIVNYQYGDRNSFRMQPMHRLDLSATLEGKQTARFRSGWTFSIYNVYGRRNPFLYYIDHQGEPYSNDMTIQAKKIAIIPFPLPSVTWNFKF